MPDVYLNNVVTTLREGLLATDTVMKVKIGDGAKFLLGEGQYVYVTLRDRVTYEVVRVNAFEVGDPPVATTPGDDLTIVRGQDDTDAKQFPVGTCVTIEWNWQQFDEIANRIASEHEATVTGTEPIIVTNPSNLLWNVAIDNAAFAADTGETDPVDPPTDGTLPLYINTLTGSVWLWNGVAWQNLNPIESFAGYALLDSPIFIGDPRGPTPAPGDNDTSLATTAYATAADAALAALVAGNLAAALAALNAAISAAGTLQNVTATAPIASSGGANPNISHNASGVTPGTYDGAIVNATGHVTGGSLVQSLASIVSGQSMTFANGVVVKWGLTPLFIASTMSNGYVNHDITFPVAFPAGCLTVIGNEITTSLLTASTFRASCYCQVSQNVPARQWLALGY